MFKHILVTGGAGFIGSNLTLALQEKYPDAERPYKTFGYPVVPILFLLVAGWLLLNTIWTSPKQSFFGIFLILLGLPVYYYLTRINKTETREEI